MFALALLLSIWPASAARELLEFLDDSPVLMVTRQIRTAAVGSRSCEQWLAALTPELAVQGSSVAPQADSGQWLKAFEAWEPQNEADLDEVSECDSQPCLVKLADDEVARMKASAPEARSGMFRSLVAARVMSYERTQQRREYEFPGKLVEPWAYFEKSELKGALIPPSVPALRVRRIDFAPGRLKVLRQVVDVRISRSSTRAALWLRDAYTNHYFDGWGEWIEIQCDSTAKEAAITAALLVELDLLKKSDLFSRLGRGQMKNAVRDHGRKHLDLILERLKNKATASTPDKPKGL